jgi:hypothetical protein
MLQHAIIFYHWSVNKIQSLRFVDPGIIRLGPDDLEIHYT